MKINKWIWQKLTGREKEKLALRSETDIADVSDAVSEIINNVKEKGDAALKEYNAKFDGTPEDSPVIVSEKDILQAEKALPEDLKKAIEYSIENVRRFHIDQEPDGIEWKEIRPGILAGERTLPIDSAAFYIPRARGSFPSMLYMMAVPAQIAGVKRLAMASPPDKNGQVDAACLYTAKLCGIDEIYAVGGAQAWAAFAYGTESVKKTDKCLGPGSKYVAAAKRLLSDVLDCGLPAGPSESIILADGKQDAADIARNLMVEAEHGSDSAVLLITDSGKLAEETIKYLKLFTGNIEEPRKTFIKDVFSGYGGIILTESIDEGAEAVNMFATEHLQIRTEDPFAVLNKIKHAGEILLGPNTPFSAANYSVGANAVLPTGGHARTWSGVSVRDFKKRSSIVYMSEEGLKDLKKHAETLAEYEGFPAHKKALSDWGR